MNPVRIVIFAKAPIPGFAKTRLIPAVGARGAANIARFLLMHSIDQALSANVGPVELCVTPATPSVWAKLNIPKQVVLTSQPGGNLGKRMGEIAKRALEGGESTILIGTDCPALGSSKLIAAAESLRDFDSCLTPTEDGGYALLGLREYLPDLFTDIPWSTEVVAELTKNRLRKVGRSIKIFPVLHDIDVPDDLKWLPGKCEVFQMASYR